MPNILLTWQVAGRLFAEEVASILGDQATPDLLAGARACAEDCGKIVGLLDANDPRAKQQEVERASQK